MGAGPRETRALFVTPLLLALLLDISTISVPVEVSLAPLLPEVEKQVPKTFRDVVTEHGVQVQYDVVRDPIALKMIGAGLHATTVARYSVRACPSPLPCISCGIGEPKRQATIALQSHFTWDQQWRLRSTTRAQPASFPNRCAVTVFNFDVTDRYVAPVVNDQLRQAAASIDRNTPSLTNIRPIAQQIWTALSTPVKIAPRTWLLFEPSEVALSPLRGDGLRVFSTLSIRANTEVVIVDVATNAPRPLPPLKTAELPGGLHIPFDLHVPYEDASKLATEQFGNRTYKLQSGVLRIGALRFLPGTNGKVRLEAMIDYNGGRLKKYNGPMVMEGTPRYDAAKSAVVVPDLEYTIESRRRNIFFRVAERVAHDEIRARLRESARYVIAAELKQIRDEITRAITRTLARGVTMQGRIDGVEPKAVTAAANDLVIRAEVTGQAVVRVSALAR